MGNLRSDAWNAGYSEAKHQDLAAVAGSHTIEASQAAFRYLAQKYLKEYRQFCNGFEEHNREKFHKLLVDAGLTREAREGV